MKLNVMINDKFVLGKNKLLFGKDIIAKKPLTYVQGTIHLRRRQFFTTIRQQIWQIFDPSPPKHYRRLKWMVPMYAPLFSSPLLSAKLDSPVIKISERHSLKLKKPTL